MPLPDCRRLHRLSPVIALCYVPQELSNSLTTLSAPQTRRSHGLVYGTVTRRGGGVRHISNTRIPQSHALDVQSSYVQLRAPPMTALGVILHHQKMSAPPIRRSKYRRTWILGSVFERNH